MDYKIMLDAFEGPMDLLLHLIDKAEIDIYDIPISHIAEQFLDYIRHMEDINLGVTAEFLVMAATLLEIKSKMLLPNKSTSDNIQIEMEEIDPRAELVRRLVEYKKYKNAAEELRLFEILQSKVYYKPKEDLIDYEDYEIELEGLNMEILLKSISKIIIKRSKKDKVLDISEIQREEYTLEKCMEDIKREIEINESIKFSDLLDEENTKKEIIAFFLSILELIRLKYIKVKQEKDFSDLIIIRRINEEK